MKSKIISIIIFLLAAIFFKLVLPAIQSGYTFYNDYKDCAAFETDSAEAVKACNWLIQSKNVEVTEHAYAVLWLHMARIHAGQDDQQEFERNSLPYLNGSWPTPLLALYLGKTTAEDVYAKAKPGLDKDYDPPCEAKFYVGKWYLKNNAKDEAKKAFQSASSICGADQMERTLAQDELKALGP